MALEHLKPIYDFNSVSIKLSGKQSLIYIGSITYQAFQRSNFGDIRVEIFLFN